MLPFIARGTSACSPGAASCRQTAVMIMPGVQKPHWNACAAANASWTARPRGCIWARPSIVVISVA
jgi:hypothetical protein